MLTELEVKNFKAFKDFHAKGFKRLNLIGGRNNSGKTTFLEAIFFPFDLRNPNFLLQHYVFRHLETMPITADFLFITLFHCFETEQPIEMKIKFSEKEKFHLLAKVQKAGVTSDYTTTVNAGDIKPKNSYNTQNNDFNQLHLSLTHLPTTGINQEQTVTLTVAPNGLPHVITNPLSMPVIVKIGSTKHINMTAQLGVITKNRDEKDFIEILQKVIEPKIEAITTVNEGVVQIYVQMRGLLRLIPAALLGEGTNAVMYIMMQMFCYPNSVILIDEIDSGLHYSVIERLWAALQEMAEKFNCQIFAITHSDECLTAFSKLKGEDHAYIRLVEADNKIHAQIFGAEELDGAREMNLEMR